MDMKHDEVVRIIPGARTAVLLIHGICGTPNHFVGGIPLMEWIPADWSIISFFPAMAEPWRILRNLP